MSQSVLTAAELVLTNATLVLPTEVVHGTIRVADGHIADIASGQTATATAVDCDDDLVMPGLVELHTDNLEKHTTPRPQVRWPMLAAVLAHDAELVAAGMTTVLNGIAIGSVIANSLRSRMLDECIEALSQERAEGLMKADHYLHFRCEISAPNVLGLMQKYHDADTLRLVSVMDHTPNQRQWVHVDKYRARVRALEGLSMRCRSTPSSGNVGSFNSATRPPMNRRYEPGVSAGGCRWPVMTTRPSSTSLTRQQKAC